MSDRADDHMLVCHEIGSLAPPWTSLATIALGDGAIHHHLLVERDGTPFRCFELRKIAQAEAWLTAQAVLWQGSIAIGFAERVYLVPLAGGAARLITLGSYFSRLLSGDDWLIATSGCGIARLGPEGAVLWRSAPLAIDGVIVHSVADGIIAGEATDDPPDRWTPFRLALADGTRRD
jgi:hypothetical protein